MSCDVGTLYQYLWKGERKKARAAEPREREHIELLDFAVVVERKRRRRTATSVLSLLFFEVFEMLQYRIVGSNWIGKDWIGQQTDTDTHCIAFLSFAI